MKNRSVLAIAFIIIGILIALIPAVIFPVCNSSEMRMACYYTAKAEIGVGVVVALFGVFYALFGDEKVRTGISLAVVGISPLVLLFPLKLTGICKMSDMACRIKTLPALIVIFVILLAVSLGNTLFLLKKKG